MTTKEDRMIEALVMREHEGGPHYQLMKDGWNRWDHSYQGWTLIEDADGNPVSTAELFDQARNELGLCDEEWHEQARLLAQ